MECKFQSVHTKCLPLSSQPSGTVNSADEGHDFTNRCQDLLVSNALILTQHIENAQNDILRSLRFMSRNGSNECIDLCMGLCRVIDARGRTFASTSTFAKHACTSCTRPACANQVLTSGTQALWHTLHVLFPTKPFSDRLSTFNASMIALMFDH